MAFPVVEFVVVPQLLRRPHSRTAAASLAQGWCMLCEWRGKNNNVYLCPKLTLTGLVLTGEVWSLPLRLGLSSCPLHSLPSEVKELCLLCGKLLYCLVMSALSRKTRPCFSRVQGRIHSPLIGKLKILAFLTMTDDSCHSNVLFNIPKGKSDLSYTSETL